jgi:hypothetical protein
LIDLFSEKYPAYHKYFEELTESEVLYFASQLNETTTGEQFDKEMERIKDDVVSVIGEESKKKGPSKTSPDKCKKSFLDDIP